MDSSDVPVMRPWLTVSPTVPHQVPPLQSLRLLHRAGKSDCFCSRLTKAISGATSHESEPRVHESEARSDVLSANWRQAAPTAPTPAALAPVLA